jgi:arsenate reductase
MAPSVFTYKGCDTCRKATRWLAAQGIAFEEIPIREQPPSVPQIRKMFDHLGGDLRRLFNTSGQDYRALELKDKLAAMTEDAAIALLASNGNLVKRPFVLGKGVALIGFREAEWSAAFCP